MEKTYKREKSRIDRMTQLAQTMISCASPDVYFSQNETLQQVNLPAPEPTDYTYLAPEQIFTLARVENHSVLTHHSRS
jgi:hypothetical protein